MLRRLLFFNCLVLLASASPHALQSARSAEVLPGHWEIKAPVPAPRSEVATAVLDGKIFLVGGYLTGVASVATVYEYDPVSDRWRARAPMPTPRGALAVGVIGGKIFAIGGVGSDGKNTNANEAYDPAADRWVTYAPIPTAHHGRGTVVLINSVYVIAGGPKPGTSFSSVNEVFTPVPDERAGK